MEEEQGGVSMSDIWTSVKKKLWLVLVIVVVCTAGFGLLFAFAINPRLSEYSLDFRILYPTSSTSRYPDGSPFYDFDIVSQDFLERAKASDEAFSSLDLKKMLRDGDIKLDVDRREEGKGDTEYSLTVKASSFQNVETAEKFLRAVAGVPVAVIVENAGNLNYKLDEPTYTGASFEEKIKLLSDLKKTLITAYDEWIALYGGTYVVNGRTLSNHRASLYVTFGENTQSALEAEGQNNGYYGLDVGGYETLDAAIKARQSELSSERELNASILEALKEYLGAGSSSNEPVSVAAAAYAADGKTEEEGGSTTVIINPSQNADISETIAALVKRNEQIARQLTVLTPENVKNYLARLDAQFSRLQAAAETVAGVATSVYGKNTAAVITSRAVESDGGVNLILVIVIAFVLSLLFGGAFAYFWDHRKNGKNTAPEAPMPENNGEESKE